MLGLGGSIGTGLFLGSSVAISFAGPGVLLSYLIGGIIAAATALSLTEMAVKHPSAGSLGHYATQYLGEYAGFLIRWIYFLCQVLAAGLDATAIGIYMQHWATGTSPWVWAVGSSALLAWINTLSVGYFGVVEYGMSLIKVAAIVAFVLLGAAKIFGLFSPALGLHNVIGLQGGFLPHGFSGVWLASMVATLAFFGLETIAVASGEMRDPETSIPAALRGMAIRLLLFYILAIAVIIAVVPWTSIGGAAQRSPFVTVFEQSGLPFAGDIMSFVVLCAALSSMNACIFTSSRMLFSLGRDRYAPQGLGKLNARGAPGNAVRVAGLCVLAIAFVSKLTDRAYLVLLGVTLFSVLAVWLMIFLCHFAFRAKNRGEHLSYRAPLYPWPQIVAMGLLVSVGGTMAVAGQDWNIAWIVGVPTFALLSLAYLAIAKRRKRRLQAIAISKI